MAQGSPPSDARSIVLQFDPKLDELPLGHRLSGGMSCVAVAGRHLWLAHDETVSIERLTLETVESTSIRFAGHRRFNLADFIALPLQPDERPACEADLEGIAFCDDCLWIVGSHSAQRDGAEGRTTRDAIAALAKVRRVSNRFVLARIPTRAKGADVDLASRSKVPAGRTLRAGTLAAGRKGDALTTLLRDDPHLAPFLSLPSKDNGFDIEGIAAGPDGHLFLGLRAPVIDGWACVLELRVGRAVDRRGHLKLRKLSRHRGDSEGAYYRKHFLRLSGAGVRDLCAAGSDLLVLTGPPMRGAGVSQVRVWKNAFATSTQRLLKGDDLPVLLELPYPEKDDHPEAIAVVGIDRDQLWLLVINDSASKRKSQRPGTLNATLRRLTMPSK